MLQDDKLERIVTAAIAILLILGTLTIIIYDNVTGKNSPISDWLYSSTTLVIGYYFGHHKGATPKNGTAAGTPTGTNGGGVSVNRS